MTPDSINDMNTTPAAETTSDLCADCLAFYTRPRAFYVVCGQGKTDDVLLFALDEFFGEESDDCQYLATVKDDRQLKDGDLVLGQFDETFELYETCPFEVVGFISRGGEFFINVARMSEVPDFSDPDYSKGLFLHEEDFDYHPHDQHCECDQCLTALFDEFPELLEELEEADEAV